MEPPFVSRILIAAVAVIGTIAAATRPSQAQNVIEHDVYVWVSAFDAP